MVDIEDKEVAIDKVLGLNLEVINKPKLVNNKKGVKGSKKSKNRRPDANK